MSVTAELSLWLKMKKQFIIALLWVNFALNSVLLEDIVSTAMRPYVITLNRKTNAIWKASTEQLWNYLLTVAGFLLLSIAAP